MSNYLNFFTIVFDWVFVLQLLAVSFSVVWVFYPYKKNKQNIFGILTHIAILFGFGTLMNMLLFGVSATFRFLAGINFPIAWLFSIIIYLVFFCKIRISARVIMGATQYVSVISMCDLGHHLGQIVEESGVSIDLVCIISYILIVIFALIMRRFSVTKYGDIPKSSVSMIMINDLIASLVVLYYERELVNNGNEVNNIYFVLLGLIYLTTILTYLMLFYHCKIQKENTDLIVENKLLEADRQMICMTEQAIEDIRSIRHDIKNQYKVIELMLEEGKYDDLKDYLNSLSDLMVENVGLHFIKSGNSLVDSILNMELMKTAAHGVMLTTKLNCPAELPFDQSDLCRVLVNLIDNATEATLRLKGKKAPVDCKIGRRSDYLYICVTNAIAEGANAEKILSFKTSKVDSQKHGYGHRIVERIVQKYNGYVNYSIEENEFIAEVMLDLMSAQKEKL